MKIKHFLKDLNHEQVIKAIKHAEQKIAGPVRLYVSHRAVDDPMAAAQRAFTRLGIHKSVDQNGILLFVAPEAQKFAVFGNKTIHDCCGDELWRQITSIMSEHFKAGNFTNGIVEALAALPASKPNSEPDSSPAQT
jgi:uncharacterized membrane protein